MAGKAKVDHRFCLEGVNQEGKEFSLFRINPDSTNFYLAEIFEKELGDGKIPELTVLTLSEVEKYVKNLMLDEVIDSETASTFLMMM